MTKLDITKEVLGIGPKLMVCIGYDDRIYWDDLELCDLTQDELKQMAHISIVRWQKLLERLNDEA